MSGAVFVLVFLLAQLVVCVLVARLMAFRRQRSQRAWMWAAALFGPIPLGVLAMLPRRAGGNA